MGIFSFITGSAPTAQNVVASTFEAADVAVKVMAADTTLTAAQVTAGTTAVANLHTAYEAYVGNPSDAGLRSDLVVALTALVNFGAETAGLNLTVKGAFTALVFIVESML